LVKKRRFDRRDVIDGINDSFPELKTNMFIRTQKTWILRHYWQYLRSGGLLGLHDFVESLFNNEKLDAHCNQCVQAMDRQAIRLHR
jgi:NAD-specific glutamate dehydrogenase